MKTIPLNLGRQSNPGAEPMEGVARLINCRAEIGGEEQKVQWPLRAVAGLTSLGTVATTGGIRAMIEVDGNLYGVAGRSIFQAEAGGTTSILGGMPSDGLVTMARNARQTGAQVAVVCDGLMKIIDNGSIVDVTDPDLGQPNSVCTVGNHFILSSADGKLRATEINDGTSIDALDVTTAASSPDGLLRVMARGNSVVALGQRSFEVWRYDGNNDGFPFALDQAVSVGCWSAKAVAATTIITRELVTDTIAWAAADKDGAFAGIVMLDGYTARKISIPAVDRDMRDATDPTQITATAWTDGGHAYIAFTVPGVTTWVYDTATSLWHERQSYGADEWIIQTTAVLGGRIVAGHRSLPNLYWLDPAVHVEGSDPLVVTIQTPPLHAYPDCVEMNTLYLDCVTGVGLNTTTPADLDPVVMMAMSRDGSTFGTELSRALGRQGQTRARLSWHGLGSTDHRGVTFRFRASAAVVRSFMGASFAGAKIAA